MIVEEDFEFHRYKLIGKTYVSKSLSFSGQNEPKFHIASKVIDRDDSLHFALEHGEVC